LVPVLSANSDGTEQITGPVQVLWRKASMQDKLFAGTICSALAAAGLSCLAACALDGSGKIASQTRKLGPYHAVRLKLPATLTVEAGQAGDLSIEADDNLLPHIITRVTNGELLIDSDQDFHKIKQITIKAKTAKLDNFDVSGVGSTTIKGLGGGNLSINADGASSTSLDGKLESLKASLKGTSSLKAAALNTGSLDLEADGASSINLSGKTGKLKASLRGTSNLSAPTLEGSSAGIEASGTSRIILNGKADKLTASLQGTSSLKAAGLTVKSASVSITGAGSAEVNATVDLDASVAGASSIKYKGSPKVTRKILGVGSINNF
jgi:hypothetical protein